MEAAKWLAKVRRSASLSQRELAEKTGLSHTTIAQAEREGRGSFETWITLARHFGESEIRVLGLAELITQKTWPTKDDLINRINQDLAEMSPEARRTAHEIIRILKRGK
jgi:transcriptional regulator with XRE-family HTH domain